MHNWEDEGRGHCTTKEDWEDVQNVAKTLDIPVQKVDFVKEYWNNVFADFLDELRKGRTPNPDYFCNIQIKFHSLYNFAMNEIKADYLATGHYATIGWKKLPNNELEAQLMN